MNDLITNFYRNALQSFYLKSSSPVLLYHYVENGSGNTHIHRVSIESFRLQLSKIKKKFAIVRIDDLLTRLKNGKSIEGLASITFDDATVSAVTHAVPILEEEGVPGTIFINSSFARGEQFWRDQVRVIIDSKLEAQFIQFAGSAGKNLTVDNFYSDTKNVKLVNLAELKDLLAEFVQRNKIVKADSYGRFATVDALRGIKSDLVQFGNHTSNHLVLAGLTFDQQINEIRGCADFLKDHFEASRISGVFSIPFGDAGSYNAATFDALKACEYDLALTSRSMNYFRSERISRENDILLYNRFMPKEHTRFY